MSPLTFPQKPQSLKLTLATKLGNVILRSVSWIKPELLLAVFLMVAILLAFVKIQAIGFYTIFGIFIIMYFIERITKIILRKKDGTK